MHALAVFALVVWLLAFIQTLVNLRVTPRLDANRIPRHTPLVSIVVPPRNDAHIIESSDAEMAALRPYFEMRTFGEQVGMPMLAFFVFAGFPVWYSNRSNVVSLAIGGGAGNLIRSEVFESIGGFQALQGAIVDDVGL